MESGFRDCSASSTPPAHRVLLAILGVPWVVILGGAQEVATTLVIEGPVVDLVCCIDWGYFVELGYWESAVLRWHNLGAWPLLTLWAVLLTLAVVVGWLTAFLGTRWNLSHGKWEMTFPAQ